MTVYRTLDLLAELGLVRRVPSLRTDRQMCLTAMDPGATIRGSGSFWGGRTITFIDSVQTFITIFLAIFIEAAPFLLLGSLVSGLIEAFVDQERLGKFFPGNPFVASLIGTVMGLAFPVCECGLVPVTRRLFRKGLPLSAGVAFLLAAPIVNPVVLAGTWAAFGNSAVFWGRVVMALLVAGTIGLLFALAPKPEHLLLGTDVLPAAQLPPFHVVPDQREQGSAWRRWVRKIRGALIVAGEEFFDMGRYLVLGSLLAAAMQVVVPQAVLLQIGRGPVTSVLAMLLLAFVLSVCSTVDAFLALAFVNSFTSGDRFTIGGNWGTMRAHLIKEGGDASQRTDYPCRAWRIRSAEEMSILEL